MYNIFRLKHTNGTCFSFNLEYMCIYKCLSVAVWGLQDSKTSDKSCNGCSEGRVITLSLWCGEADLSRAATGRSPARPHRSHHHRCVFVSVESKDVKFVLHLESSLLTLEDMCEPMIQSLLRTIIPRIDRTLQEVATPTCDGFASSWQYFLEMCDDIIELGSKSTSVTDIKKEVHRPVIQFKYKNVLVMLRTLFALWI